MDTIKRKGIQNKGSRVHHSQKQKILRSLAEIEIDEAELDDYDIDSGPDVCMFKPQKNGIRE